ncbi:ATP-binding protein [Catenuloplanes sp. NPDC051500]|uniref:sensor histidine kinase n=1 Tax=Catenuloplanes sp. NPDC051500 TaxID=3363959 RepID=UPI00379D8081
MPRLQRSVPALAAGVAALGLLATVSLCGALDGLAERNQRQALDRRVDLVRAGVAAEAARYVDALTDLAAAIGAQTDLTADDYARISAAVTVQRLPAVTAVSVLVAADSADVPATEAYWRGHGATSLTLRPDQGEREHVFAVLSREFDGRPPMVGPDLAKRTELVEALRHSANTNAVAVSRTYVLARDENLPADRRQLSFVLAVPFYRPTADRISGWAVMGLRGGTFLAAAMRNGALSMIEVELLDSSAEGLRTPVARWPAGEEESDAALTRTVAVGVAQRTWQLTVKPAGTLAEGEAPYLVPASAVAGTLITALVVGIVLILGLSRGHALARVATATAALQADISRREETERQLRRTEDELRGFLAMTGHDLKSPLASVAGHVELLRGPGEPDPADWQAIERGLGRMNRLVDDLLTYATADAAPLEPRPVDLRAMAAEIAADHATVRIGPLPTVMADPRMLRHVLENLVGNAVKYTRPGAAPDVEIVSVPAGARTRIEVADHGIGVPNAERARVFEAFHRSPNGADRPGTGLGLAICQRIVERHGGEIGVDANDGGGSRFWFTLP